MTRIQPASDTPPDSGVSGPTNAAPDDASRAARRVPESGFSPRPTPAAGNPFASLKQEKTVEAKVAGHLLDLAKRDKPDGDTSVYHVPRELLEMARRKKKGAAESPAEPVEANPKAQRREPLAPVGIRPSGARVHPAASALSSLLPPAVGQSLRVLQRMQSLDSRTIAVATLRGALTAGPWLALIYAAYRLITG
jgi:hypothetical protein